MPDKMMNYKQQVEWYTAIIIKALSLKNNNNYDGAISLMDSIISNQSALDSQLLCEAFSWRASFREDQGDLQNAEKDLREALSLSQDGSYSRYIIELELGTIAKKLKLVDKAIFWFKQALLSSTESREEIIGGTALKLFLNLKAQNSLNEQELSLCVRVIDHSWRLLNLSGKPDLSNLAKVADILIHAAGRTT